MRRTLQVIAIAALVVACGGEDTSETTLAPSNGATTTQAPASEADTTVAPAAGGGATITIESFSFGSPIEVAAGEEITIENADNVGHTFTADEGAFDSGTIAGGSSATVTIDEPGEYGFFCEIHPSMVGSITVTG